MLIKIELGPDAITYMRSYLAVGEALGHALLEVPLEHGRVVTYLPESADPGKVAAFWEGGINYEGGITRLVAEFISSYLCEGDNRLAFFEDMTSRPESPWTTEPGARYVVLGREVYLYLTPESATQEEVHRTMVDSYSWRFVAVLSDTESSLNLLAGQEIGIEFLQLLAASVQHIVVGAYDSEGYLIWSHQEP